eukprot:TRINITY_DN4276_c0_g2_i10.p1 TRINITY_DN4276_c0_g2~~TRINITY_DN4276_c0_g2_i10.p1  ORF type:complete len:317 (+),score=99.72 TRINITY_DN4276_c0_g2_i10:61-1011(+)
MGSKGSKSKSANAGAGAIPKLDIAYQAVALVPVANEPATEKALHYAIHFAKLLDLKVHIVGVAKEGDAATLKSLAGNEPQEGEAEVVSTVRRAVKKVGETGLAVTSNIRVDSDIPRAIVGEAEDKKSRLVFLGTHGRSDFQRLIQSSVVEGVLRHTSRPVLIVRYDEGTNLELPHGIDFKKWMFAHDGGRVCRAVFPEMLTLSAKMNVELTLLSVVKQGDDAQRQKEIDLRETVIDLAKREAKKAGLKAVRENYVTVDHEGICSTIVAAAGNEHVIVVGTRGEQGAKRVFGGSVTEELIHHAKTPVLAINVFPEEF